MQNSSRHTVLIQSFPVNQLHVLLVSIMARWRCYMEGWQFDLRNQTNHKTQHPGFSRSICHILCSSNFVAGSDDGNSPRLWLVASESHGSLWLVAVCTGLPVRAVNTAAPGSTRTEPGWRFSGFVCKLFSPLCISVLSPWLPGSGMTPVVSANIYFNKIAFHLHRSTQGRGYLCLGALNLQESVCFWVRFGSAGPVAAAVCVSLSVSMEIQNNLRLTEAAENIWNKDGSLQGSDDVCSQNRQPEATGFGLNSEAFKAARTVRHSGTSEEPQTMRRSGTSEEPWTVRRSGTSKAAQTVRCSVFSQW